MAGTSDTRFRFRPDATVDKLTVGKEASPVLVIDNCLAEPETLVSAATNARFSAVQEDGNYYPGIRAPAPKDYALALADFLRPLISQHLGIGTQTLTGARCALSLAVQRPEQLTIAQRVPHFDTTDPGQVAALHYLCAPDHGGVAFYRHRATGFESITEDRSKQYFETLRAEIREQGEPPREYVTASGPLFEQVVTVGAAFNRLVVYRSNLLHSGMVDHRHLSPDPATGRLTANLFARFAQG